MENRTGSIRKRRWVLLGILIVGGVGAYFGCLHPYRVHAEHAGWVVDFSALPLRCPLCTGRLEHFTYAGQPVPLPVLRDEEANYLLLHSPVGLFETRMG